VRAEATYIRDFGKWGKHTLLAGSQYMGLKSVEDEYGPAYAYTNLTTKTPVSVVNADRYNYKNPTDYSPFVFGTQGDGLPDVARTHLYNYLKHTWDLGYYAVYQGQFFKDRLTLIAGERWDRSDARQVQNYVYEQGHRRILVNMAGVTFTDSAGLGDLVGTYTMIKQRGGHIHMGTRLESLRWNQRTAMWTVGVITPEGEWKPFTARHVISSAPIRELVSSIRPLPACKPAAESLRYRDFITVALIVDKPDLFPDNWIYIHEPSVKVGRIQNFRSWSPEMVPEGMSCLGLEYFCFEGDGLWNASDDELVALAKQEIAKIGLIAESDVMDACVVRQPKAYPVYDEDYRENVAVVRRDLEGLYPTLHMVGRNGMHKYNNQDHAMMTAMLTARNILAGERIYDIWQVNEDAEYHEAGASSAQAALASERLVPLKAKTQAA